MREANDLVAGWMQAAGMTVRRDAIGNLDRPLRERFADAKIFLLGSHLDTVRDAGKFDGSLGVLLAIACVEHLHKPGNGFPLPSKSSPFAMRKACAFKARIWGAKFWPGLSMPEILI